MATNPIDELTSLLAQAGLNSSGTVTSLSDQLQSLKSINDSIAQQQAAVLAQSGASSSSGGSTAGSVLSAVGGFLGGGLGIAPLITGLTGLFGGGGDSNSAPSFNRFIPPATIGADAGFSGAKGGGIFGADSASGNSPRAVTQSAPQITVQVQAMDSQSFLDRSQDIANAVRQAMLETTVLNDVIREV